MSDAISVTGGVGGTRARLEDLERCAAVLVAVAAGLGELDRVLARLDDVVDDAALVSPETARRARWAVSDLASAADGVPAARERARTVAEKLRRAARGYADAEAAVTSVLQRWTVTVAHAVGEAGPLAWLGVGAAAGTVAVVGGAAALPRVAAARLLARTPTAPGLVLRAATASGGPGGPLAWLLGGPGVLPSVPRPTTATLDPVAGVLGGFVTGAAPGRRPVPGGLAPWGRSEPGLPATPVREAARTLAVPGALGGLVVHGPTALVVTPQPSARPAGRARAPRTTADLVAGVADVYPSASTPPGTVAVHRLEDPTGRTSWVVTVPGTQSPSLTGGPLPADMTSNLALTAGYPDDVSALVREAMHGAGIPPDEPVQIVGHSQGGMAAVAVANHPDVRAGYDVRTVVTAGSPVAGMPLRDGVVGLHLEHAQDGLTALDGLRPPDRVNQTFVEVDLARSPDPAQRAAGLSWSGSHEIGTYGRTAAEIGGTADASLAHATRTVEGLLGGPGTTVTTQLFTGTRLPVGPGVR